MQRMQRALQIVGASFLVTVARSQQPDHVASWVDMYPTRSWVGPRVEAFWGHSSLIRTNVLQREGFSRSEWCVRRSVNLSALPSKVRILHLPRLGEHLGGQRKRWPPRCFACPAVSSHGPLSAA